MPAEPLYLFKQIFAGAFGSRSAASLDDGNSPSISSAFARELGASFEGRLDQLKTADCVLTIGVDLAEEHQVAGFFVKRNLAKGTSLVVASSGDNGLSASADYDLKIKKDSETDLLLGLAAAIEELGLAKGKRIDLTSFTAEKASAMTGIDVETLFEVARKIATAQQPVFVYGKGLAGKAPTQALKALVDLARVAGAYGDNSSALISLKGQANSVAASLYGLDSAGRDQKPAGRLCGPRGRYPQPAADSNSWKAFLSWLYRPATPRRSPPGPMLSCPWKCGPSRKATT